MTSARAPMTRISERLASGKPGAVNGLEAAFVVWASADEIAQKGRLKTAARINVGFMPTLYG